MFGCRNDAGFRRLLVAALVLGGHHVTAAAKTRVTPAASTSASASPNTTLTFDASCKPGLRATIAAVGDLLFHDALQAQALKPGQTFRPFWAPVASVLATADLTYGNLESPLAEGVRPGGYAHKDPGRVLDRVVYGRKSDALVFNTHPSVATDLAAAGFDIVSTANNHSADRGVLGIDRTLDALSDAGLAATGSRRSAATPAERVAWSTRTTTANGITVAWLACTYGLNGMPDPKSQVLQCYRDEAVIMDELRALAADPSVDATILTPHWGSEGSPRPLSGDRLFARAALDAGAAAVIGTHPHVLQPWEKHTTPDGRDGLIIYSTGNFISNQKSNDQRTGIIALLEVTKPDDGAPARLSAAGFIPTFVEMSGDRGHRVTELQSTSEPVRRLPLGNRVAAANFRSLPRACQPMALPDVVASVLRPVDTAPEWYEALLPLERVAIQSDVFEPTDPPGAPIVLSSPGTVTVGVAEVADTALAKPLLTVTPGAQAVSAGTWTMSGHLPPPQRLPTKNDPLRVGRLRLDALVLLSTPDLVAPLRLWHVPPQPISTPQALWTAPASAPAASRSRPSPSPSASSRSKSRPPKKRKASRSTRTRSKASSTSRPR